MDFDRNIIVCGDVHGDWKYLSKLINQKNPSIILQTGDYGYWPRWDGCKMGLPPRVFRVCGVKNKETKIYWCDGNHEDHESLLKLESNEICPNVFYMKRGSTLRLPDGRNVLFMGGAESIDKNSRMIGHDWFMEETITQKDVWNLPEERVDIVISHTCPKEFTMRGNNDITGGKSKDPSREALSYILKRYRPSLWYFGHWHEWKEGFDCGCRWVALNMTPETMWWKYLLK